VRITWTVRLLLEGLPQLGLWIALLALILATAVATLAGRSLPTPDDDGRPAESPGQVWELSRWIRRAALSDYSRWTLHRHLQGLLWEALAARQGTTAAELKRRFRTGNLVLDPDVVAFLELAGRKRFRPAAGPRGWLCRLLHGEAEAGPASVPLECIVAFMEEQLAPGPAPHISPQPEVEDEHDTG
jgi:hypothetical protein